MRHVHATSFVIAIGVGAALVLSACSSPGSTSTTPPSASTGPSGSAAGGTTASAEASGSPTAAADAPTPRPTSTITPVPGVDYDGGTVPSSCSGLITAGKWSFASDPLNDPAVVGDPVELPKSPFSTVLQPDGKRLFCVWKDPRADITHVTIDVAVVDSSKAASALEGLPGFTCGHEAEGYRCQKVEQDPQYPVLDGWTYFTRGDIGIAITQANVPTQGLLDDVSAHVF
jgi:hypothetical protein